MRISILILTSILFTISCSKSDDVIATSPTISEFSIVAENIADGTSTTNKCFINLAEGLQYNKADGFTNSNKVDFAYNYGVAGRFFENPASMLNRTNYINNWSTYNDSRMIATPTITEVEFDNLKTKEDITNLFTSKNVTVNSTRENISGMRDVAISKVFAFKDKNGKLGFLKIGDFIQNAPLNDIAYLPTQIKISK
jgi:hypothetical protein